MPPSSRTWTRLLIVLAFVFAVLNAVNALNKGGDAGVFFEGGRRLLNRENLYAGSSAAAGFIGPPFQAVFFAPFAAIAAVSTSAAKIAWHLVGLVCFAAGVWCSAKAWDAARADLGRPPRTWLPSLLFPLVAVLLPLQTNFEHQNLNPLLLALIGGATLQLANGGSAIAGVLLGTATALKVFPAILIALLLLRNRRAAIVAIVTTIVLTLLPLAIYGGAEYEQLLRDFWRLANSGWPVRGNNQSLIAAIDRYLSGFSGEGIRELHGTVVMAYSLAAGLMLLSALWTVIACRSPQRPTLLVQLSAVIVISVMLSPIAWDHYWLLMFPAFLILFDSAPWLGRPGRYATYVAAVLVSGLSPLALGKLGFNVARDLSAYTMAGVILYVSLLGLCWRMSRRSAGERRMGRSPRLINGAGTP
jgi:alpha-1,2-mannosyltransferase